MKLYVGYFECQFCVWYAPNYKRNINSIGRKQTINTRTPICINEKHENNADGEALTVELEAFDLKQSI